MSTQSINKTQNFFTRFFNQYEKREDFASQQSLLASILNAETPSGVLDNAESAGITVFRTDDGFAPYYKSLKKGSLLFWEKLGDGVIGMVTKAPASAKDKARIVFFSDSPFVLEKSAAELMNLGQQMGLAPDLSLVGGLSIEEVVKSNTVFEGEPKPEYPKGWKLYKGLDTLNENGVAVPTEDICLPPKWVQRYENSKHQLTKFVFKDEDGNVFATYEAKYETQGTAQKFIGYYDNRGIQYINPRVKININSYVSEEEGLVLRFHTWMSEITSLEIIQVIEETGLFPSTFDSEVFANKTFAEMRSDLLITDKYEYLSELQKEEGLYAKGGYRFFDNQRNYEGLVDAGPYSTLGLAGKASPQPFLDIPRLVLEKEMQEEEIHFWNPEEGFGYFVHTDAIRIHKIVSEIRLSTILIGRNYMNSGKDIILAVFNWAFNKEKSKNPKLQPPNLFNAQINSSQLTQITARTLEIIQHDYPNYFFYGQK